MAMFFAIALTITATTFIVRSEEARQRQELRLQTVLQVSSIRAKAEGTINSTLFLTRGVVAYIASHPEINQEQFHQLAKDLLLHDAHIRNMALARNNVITHMYPIKGNEAAVGLSYMDHPQQKGAVLRAIETRKTVVAGPVNLVQGGTGFISRTPIFLTPSGKETGSGSYWGIASMVIDMDTLFEIAGISSTTAKGLRIAVRGKDGLGAEGDLFFGDEIIFKSDPVLLNVTLPEGSWQIAAIPEKGWNIDCDRAVFIKFSGILVSTMLALSIWLIGRLSRERALRKAEEATAEADRKVKELADTLSQVVYRADANTFETLYINNAVEKIFGYSTKEWLEDSSLWVESIHPEDKDEVFKVLEDAKKKCKNLFYEYRIIKKDGTVRYVEDRITWERDDKGNIGSVNGFVYDITERKKAEEELQSNNELLNKIFSTTYGLIAYLDTDFRFIRVNQGYATADGHSPDFFIGKNHFDLYPNKENETIFRRVVETGEPFSVYAKPFEYAENPERGLTYWDWALIPAMDINGKVAGLLMTLMNVTEQVKKDEALRRSQEEVQAIFNNMQDTFYRTDINGNITMLSPSASELMKCDKERLMGQKLADFYENPTGRKKFLKSLKEEGGRLQNYEARIKRFDGSIIWVSTNAHFLYDESNNMTGVEGSVRDITIGKEAEEQLSLLKKAIDTTKVGITLADLQGKIIYSNPAEAMLHGYSTEELIGKDVSLFAPQGNRQHLNMDAISKSETKRRESINLRKDGSSFPVYLTSNIVKSPSNDPIGLVTVCEDITDRKKTENEIKTSREQLRNLTNSLQSAREEERKKIAREIHDELGQSLTALKIDLSLMKKKLPEDETALHNRTNQMTDIVNLTLQTVKRIAKELRPEILEELGLEAATKRYIKEFSSRSIIKCDYTIVGSCDNTSKDVSLVIFRIIQEATTNIVRHSEAKRARIYLECKEKSLLLKISDDGKGINETDSSDPMSIGLIGMNERILSVGGHFAIRGIRGVGTTVKAYIPGREIKK